MTLEPRRPGDPIQPELIRQLRERENLTQDALAQKLGVRGGKSVVSAWEKGTSACEGPVAELVLQLLGGSMAAPFSDLLTVMERRWNGAKRQSSYPWRQIALIPRDPICVDQEDFLTVFPKAALPPEVHQHHFPFLYVNDRSCYGKSADVWVGQIPGDPTKPTAYLWQLQKTGGFAYREKLWELEQVADPPHGHVLVGSLLDVVVPALAFYSKMISILGLAVPKLIAQVDLDGILGRGVVFQQVVPAPFQYFAVDHPPYVSSLDHAAAQIEIDVPNTPDEIIRTSTSVVAELLQPLRPREASVRALFQQVKLRWDNEQGSRYRRLGVIDPVFGAKS